MLAAATGAARRGCSAASSWRAPTSSLRLPVLGDVKVVSALAFDTGVFLVVVGLVLGLLRTLGAEAER